MELYNVRNMPGKALKRGTLVKKTVPRMYNSENSDSDSNTLYLNDSISKETIVLKILNNV
jgi:hypothetical protein